MTVEDDWFLVQSRATPEGRGGCSIGIDLKCVFGQIGTKDVGSTSAVSGPTTRRIKKLSVTPDKVNVLHADGDHCESRGTCDWVCFSARA